MMRPIAIVAAAACLSACGQGERNPPTQPAEPVRTTPGSAPAAQRPPGVGSVMPGTGPANFVGRWAADPSWCPNTQGVEQPIEITTTRFEGYENSCAIAAIDQRSDSYVASLVCAAEGTTTRERVRLSVSDQTLTLSYLERDDAVVALTKCTTLADTPAP